MARSSRNEARSAPKGPNMVPVFIAIGALVAAALAVAVMQDKADEKEAEKALNADEVTPQVSNPFSDRDNDPPPRAGAAAKRVDIAPPGLAEQKIFVDAKVLADKGMALVAEAQAARKEGDETTYRTKGLEAQEALDEALLQTGDWLIDLIDKYPDDRQVEAVSRIRGRWQDKYKLTRKIK